MKCARCAGKGRVDEVVYVPKAVYQTDTGSRKVADFYNHVPIQWEHSCFSCDGQGHHEVLLECPACDEVWTEFTAEDVGWTRHRTIYGCPMCRHILRGVKR